MNQKKLVIAGGVLLAVLAGVVLIWHLVPGLISGYRPVAVLRADDMVFTVEAETAWEVSQGIYMRASRGDQEIPRTFIGATSQPEKLRFVLYRSDESSGVVALVEMRNPDIALAVVDLASGESWPHGLSMAEARALLGLVEAKFGPLRLSHEVANEDRLIE